MPLPKPKPKEKQAAWINRCMGNDTMKDEFPDNDQRLAVCHQTWRDKDKRAMNAKVEHRAIEMGELAIERRDNKPPRLVGYAAVFNKKSHLIDGVFREVVKRGAFRNVLSEGQDIAALFNHNSGTVLGRVSSGTLRLSEDRVGLRYEIDLPDTKAAQDIAVSIERGDVNGSSFSFVTRTDKWSRKDEEEVRELIDIARVMDVGPCVFPAYDDTQVAVRLHEAWQAQRTRKVRDKMRLTLAEKA